LGEPGGDGNDGVDECGILMGEERMERMCVYSSFNFAAADRYYGRDIRGFAADDRYCDREIRFFMAAGRRPAVMKVGPFRTLCSGVDGTPAFTPAGRRPTVMKVGPSRPLCSRQPSPERRHFHNCRSSTCRFEDTQVYGSGGVEILGFTLTDRYCGREPQFFTSAGRRPTVMKVGPFRLLGSRQPSPERRYLHNCRSSTCRFEDTQVYSSGSVKKSGKPSAYVRNSTEKSDKLSDYFGNPSEKFSKLSTHVKNSPKNSGKFSAHILLFEKNRMKKKDIGRNSAIKYGKQFSYDNKFYK
jgi:hypothetical protein